MEPSNISAFPGPPYGTDKFQINVVSPSFDIIKGTATVSLHVFIVTSIESGTNERTGGVKAYPDKQIFKGESLFIICKVSFIRPVLVGRNVTRRFDESPGNIVKEVVSGKNALLEFVISVTKRVSQPELDIHKESLVDEFIKMESKTRQFWEEEIRGYPLNVSVQGIESMGLRGSLEYIYNKLL